MKTQSLKIASFISLALLSLSMAQFGQTAAFSSPTGVAQITYGPYWPIGSEISATSITSSSISITWSPASDNTASVVYYVYVNGMFAETGPISGRLFGMQNLSPNATYTFEIIPGDTSGNMGPGLFATFSTSPTVCSGRPACLLYKFWISGTPYPGGPIMAIGNFTDDGPSILSVQSMTMTSDFAGSNSINYSQVILPIGLSSVRSLRFILPDHESLGPHQINYTFSWQYYDNSSAQWRPQLAPTVTSTLTVVNPPSSQGLGNPFTGFFDTLERILFQSQFAPYLLVLVLAYISAVSAACVLVIKSERRKVRPSGTGGI